MSESTVKLLVIEDDPAIARVLERNLLRSGLDVCVARDGREAIRALEEDRFNFVLCDYQLPDSTGDELCRWIRSSPDHADVPIALCTAKAHEVDVAALTEELRLTQVFFKPFSIREITAAIGAAATRNPITTVG